MTWSKVPMVSEFFTSAVLGLLNRAVEAIAHEKFDDKNDDLPWFTYEKWWFCSLQPWITRG